jgi:hypothetical protein
MCTNKKAIVQNSQRVAFSSHYQLRRTVHTFNYALKETKTIWLVENKSKGKFLKVRAKIKSTAIRRE